MVDENIRLIRIEDESLKLVETLKDLIAEEVRVDILSLAASINVTEPCKDWMSKALPEDNAKVSEEDWTERFGSEKIEQKESQTMSRMIEMNLRPVSDFTTNT